MFDKGFQIGNYAFMRLGTYLERKKITPAEFGRLLGLKSRASVLRYISGERKPADDIMAKIKKVTKGAVTADSFYQ